MIGRVWTLRRTGAQRPIVVALTCITAVTAFLLAAIAGYNQRAQVVGIHDYLDGVSANAGALQVQASLSKDPDGQREAADRLFDDAIGELPLEVHTSVRTAPVEIARSVGVAESGDTAEPGDAAESIDAPPTVRLADFDDLPAHARLIDGTWPHLTGSEPWPAALEQGAAQTLGIAVGDQMSTIGTAPLTVAVQAIWAPIDPDDPYFTADAAGVRSVDELVADRAALGFLVVGTDAIVASGLKPLVNWTVMPSGHGVLPEDLAAMSDVVADLPDAVLADKTAAPTGAISAGDLARTLDVVIASVVAASAVGIIPALTIAAISLVMLIQLARLLAWQRRAETALVRSRGASTARLTRIAAGESALITVPATVLAIGGALLVSSYLDIRLPAVGWASAIAFGVLAALIIVIPAAHQARLPANRQLIDDSGRIGTAVASGTVALTCLVAAVAWWRFHRAGSALIATDDAEAHLDPIALIAPPAVLIAAAMVAWVLFAIFAGLSEWVTKGRAAAGAWLVSRDIARRATVFGIIVVLVAIAFGSVGIATVYAPTQRAAQQQANILENGAPLLVQMRPSDQAKAGDYQPSWAQVISGAVGSDSVIPGLQRAVTVGEADALFTAVPLADNGVLPVIPGSFVPDRLAAELDIAAAGVEIPDGTTQLTATVTVSLAWHRPGSVTNYSDGPPVQEPGEPGPTGQTALVTLAVWIQDPSGLATPVAAAGMPSVPLAPESPGTPVEATVTVPIPNLAPGSTVVSFEWGAPSLPYPVDIEAQITGLTAVLQADSGEPLSLDARTWVAAPQPRVGNAGAPQLLDYELTASGAGLSGSLPSSQVNIARLSTGGEGPLPVAANPALADQLDLAVGDTVDVAFSATRAVPIRVAAVSPLLPGRADQPALFTELAALEQALLHHATSLPAPDQVWVAPEDLAAAETTIRSVIPPTATITAVDTLSVGALADPAGFTLWVGAIAALLLATVGVGSVVAGLARSRRGEPVVLRASGIGIRRLVRLRRAELWATLVAAWVLGAAAAAAGILLTARTLAGSAVVGLHGSRPTIRVDVTGAVIAVGAHLALAVIIVVVYGLGVRRRARESTPSELVM